MAIGQATFGDLGGAVSDLFGYFGTQYKAKGDRIEAASYREAAGLARENIQFEKSSTAIKEMQTQRQSLKVIGGQISDVAGAGFQEKGTALDLLRDSAAQGALAKQMVGFQGAVQEEAYRVQADSYDALAQAADLAAAAEDKAGIGKLIGGGIKLGAALFTLA